MVGLKALLVIYFLYINSSKSEVIEITDDNFHDIGKYDITLLFFYSPECSYCTQLRPIFVEAEKILSENDPPMHLAIIDCVKHGKSTCEKADLTGFPNLKVYENGRYVETFTGKRTLEDITSYMKDKFGYQSKELINSRDVEAILNSKQVILIGFFEKYTGLQTAFLKASSVFRDRATFGHITSPKLLKDYDFKNDIVLYRPKHFHNIFEHDNMTYIGSGDVGDVSHFVKHHYHGLVGHRTSKSEQDFQLPLVIAYYCVDYSNSPKLTNYWRNRILKVAKEFAGDVTFAISSKYEFEEELRNLGLNVTEYDSPIVFGIDVNNTKYQMTNSFTFGNFANFVKEFVDGNLAPFVKSEPLPESNDDPVQIIVGKNFDLIVTDESDTLVQFYTPWCLECLEFASDYENLAVELSDEDIVFAKMNVAANDHPPFISIRTYPTFCLLRKNYTHIPIMYNGTLDPSELILFIAKHTTEELKRFDRNGDVKVNDHRHEL